MKKNGNVLENINIQNIIKATVNTTVHSTTAMRFSSQRHYLSGCICCHQTPIWHRHCVDNFTKQSNMWHLSEGKNLQLRLYMCSQTWITRFTWDSQMGLPCGFNSWGEDMFVRMNSPMRGMVHGVSVSATSHLLHVPLCAWPAFFSWKGCRCGRKDKANRFYLRSWCGFWEQFYFEHFFEIQS